MLEAFTGSHGEMGLQCSVLSEGGGGGWKEQWKGKNTVGFLEREREAKYSWVDDKVEEG